MREIKFRGRRVDNGEWVYGYPIIVSYKAWIKDINDKTTNPRCLAPDFADFRCVEVEKETVGQYTGLTDKKGKQIFEGDIARTADGSMVATIKIGECYPEPVKYCCELCGIEKHTVHCLHAYDKDGEYLIEDNKSLEIIGNIYEDGHLLKK